MVVDISSTTCLNGIYPLLSDSESFLVLNREMTHCSDEENDEQKDDRAEKSNEDQKKRSKGRKHVSFPPDERIVSSFAEHRNTDRTGKLKFNYESGETEYK